MYKDQFQPWIPGVKVIVLNSDDAAIIHRMSHGQPHFGKSEREFLVKLYESAVMADNAIHKAKGA